ncbi:hypothetical protein ACN8ZM_40450 (plasmid) [Burkholderia aenigmatica]|uniref:hypothetical protein n=1 Tax=Burkholderia aenigmatica TaxID=2015348 RepID=UPI003B4384B4
MSTEIASHARALGRINGLLQHKDYTGHQKGKLIVDYVRVMELGEGQASEQATEQTAFALSAICSVWDRLGVSYDLKAFVDMVTSGEQLTQLEDTAVRSVGGADADFLREWLGPFQRATRPGDPLASRIDTLKIRAALGPYLEAFKGFLASTDTVKPQLKVETATHTQEPAASPSRERAVAPKIALTIRKKTIRKKIVIGMLVLGVAAAWTHKLWSDRAAGSSEQATAHAE